MLFQYSEALKCDIFVQSFICFLDRIDKFYSSRDIEIFRNFIFAQNLLSWYRGTAKRKSTLISFSLFFFSGHPNPDHMHNVVYPEVLSHSHPDLELPFPNDSLDNMSFSDLLNERMGGDFEEEEQNIPAEPIPSTSHVVDLQGPENLDLEGYDAISSQYCENPVDQLHLDDKHTIEDIEKFVDARLESLGYEKSRSQPETPGDGNCWIHGILDQLR